MKKLLSTSFLLLSANLLSASEYTKGVDSMRSKQD